jgi:uncharacterized protein (UPF0264 family)
MAAGEWIDSDCRPIPAGVTLAKWGLSGLCLLHAGIMRQRSTQFLNGAAPVLVAYADHVRAQSPDVEELAASAVELRFPAFLIDTAVKDGSTLLDWIAPATLARIRFKLADAGVPIALAGSLDAAGIRKLAPVAPDWFAVRGAACAGGRNGTIDLDRVRRLKALIADFCPPGGG